MLRYKEEWHKTGHPVSNIERCVQREMP